MEGWDLTLQYVYNVGSSAVCIRCGIIWWCFPSRRFLWHCVWDCSVSNGIRLHLLAASRTQWSCTLSRLVISLHLSNYYLLGSGGWVRCDGLYQCDWTGRSWLSESLTGDSPPFPGLDDLWGHDSPSHWHTPALVELQQEEIWYPQSQEKVNGVFHSLSFPRCPGAFRLQRVSQTQSLLP